MRPDAQQTQFATLANCARFNAESRVILAEAQRELADLGPREQALYGQRRDILERSAEIAGQIARGVSEVGALVADRQTEAALAAGLAGIETARRELRAKMQRVLDGQSRARHYALEHLAAREREAYAAAAQAFIASWARCQALHEAGAGPPGPGWGAVRVPALEADNAPDGSLLQGAMGGRDAIARAASAIATELRDLGLAS